MSNKSIIILVVLVLIAAAALYWSGIWRQPVGDSTIYPPAATDNSKPASNPTSNPSGTPAGPPPAVPTKSTTVITLTDSGWSPKTATIKKGDSVVFQNNSTAGMWPASAPHPQHDAYPEKGLCGGSLFDSCASISSGGSWTIQFNRTGTWKFHNHLNPSFTGSITVQ